MLEEEGKKSDAIETRFRYLYQWHPEQGLSLEAFLAAVQTTVTSSETKYGRHDAVAVGLRTIEASDTAEEVSGYYSQEKSRVASLFILTGVPWRDGYRLERGDIISFKPKWYSATKKGRVIETTLREDGHIDLRVVEVS